MNYFMISLIVLVGAMLLSRVVTMRALSTLDNEQKSQLVDISRKMSRYQVIGLLVLIVLLFATMRYMEQYKTYVMLAYFVVLLLFLVIRSAVVYMRLRKMGFPQKYLNTYLLGMGIQTAGIIAFVVLILMEGGMAAGTSTGI